MKPQFRDKNVAVAGYAVENRILADFLNEQGAVVTVLDENPVTEVPEQFERVLGESAFTEANQYDFVFRTPGVQPHKFPEGTNLTSATELFLNTFRDQTVAITGTKGKGTTSALLHMMLVNCGLDAKLVGNIGQPAIAEWDNITPETVVVYEISSFQLMGLDVSPHWAVTLMIEPDHLDWHTDMDEYIEAKSQISRNQQSGDYSFYLKDHEVSKRVASHGEGQKIPFYDQQSGHVKDGEVHYNNTQIIQTTDVGLLGKHNLQNVCAALTAFWHIAEEHNIEVEQRVDATQRAIAEFKGLEHRLEPVESHIDSVQFFNDSQATGPASCLAALEAFEGQDVCAIIGGSDKGADLAAFAHELASRPQLKHILLIGDSRVTMAHELENHDYQAFTVVEGGDFSKIVPQAIEKLPNNTGVILLSPGFASFGLFENYQQRGHLFKQAVQELDATV